MRRLPHRIQVLSLALMLVLAAQTSKSQTRGAHRIQAIRFWSFGDVTRVAIQTQGEYKLTSDQIDRPARLYFDLTGLLPPSSARRGVETIAIGDRRVRQIRVAEVSPNRTRVVFDLEGPVEVVSSQLVDPDRLMIEIRPKAQSNQISVAESVTGSKKLDDDGTTPQSTLTIAPSPAPVSGRTDPAGAAPRTNAGQRSEEKRTSEQSTVPAPKAHLDLASGAHRAARDADDVSPAKANSTGDRSLVRVFGLKLDRVVIDPGHGGHDTGTIGPNGLMEKELVLDIALRLGRLITQDLGAQVIYTRSTDIFIPLEERTKIANDTKADLFISIHANSSPQPSATGVETYYFNLHSDKAGLDVAMRENASSTSSIADLNDLLHRAVLTAKLDESREFAQKVQNSLWSMSTRMNARSRDRGVRQAPFVVLIGATMPSILAEIGFVSNPHDARLMNKAEQREKIAEALYKGIAQYASTLSHVQVANAPRLSRKRLTALQ